MVTVDNLRWVSAVGTQACLIRWFVGAIVTFSVLFLVAFILLLLLEFVKVLKMLNIHMESEPLAALTGHRAPKVPMMIPFLSPCRPVGPLETPGWKQWITYK